MSGYLIAVLGSLALLGAGVATLGTVSDGVLSAMSVGKQARAEQKITALARALRQQGKVAEDGTIKLGVSALPGRDPWGTAWTLCVWERTKAENTLPMAAVISSGADKAFQTTCEQAETTKNGDDLVRRVMVPAVREVAHAVEARESGLYGAPVKSLEALQGLDPESLRKGETRLVTSNGLIYQWSGVEWTWTGENEESSYYEAVHTPPLDFVDPGPLPVLACGGGSCLAALDSWETTFFAGPISYGAGHNAGDFGAGYVFNTSYPAFQPLNIGGHETVAVSTLAGASGFITSTGLLFTAGNNLDGKLGNGNAASTTAFSQVASNVQAVSLGVWHTLRVDTDGSIWAVGNKGYFKYDYKGVQLNWEKLYDPLGGNRAVAVAYGNEHSVALLENGVVMTAGFAGGCSVLGTTQRWTSGDYRIATRNLAPILGGATAISASGSATFAVVGGKLMAAGCNNAYELGSAAALGSYTTGGFKETGVTSVRNVAASFSSVAVVKTNGELWAAGVNAYCQYKTPASANTNWVKVADNVSAVWTTNEALMWQDTNGDVWGRGRDAKGRFGQGLSGDRCTPVQVR